MAEAWGRALGEGGVQGLSHDVTGPRSRLEAREVLVQRRGLGELEVCDLRGEVVELLLHRIVFFSDGFEFLGNPGKFLRDDNQPSFQAGRAG